MSEAKQLPLRSEVEEELTWDLENIFESDEAYQEAFEEVKEKIPELKEYQGTLDKGSENLYQAIEKYLEVSRELGNVYVYTHLKNDQDTSNHTYQEMNDRATSLVTEANEASSWLVPEILELDKETLESYLEENNELKQYEHYLERIMTQKEHVLSADKESMLAAATDVFETSSRTFSVLNNADLTFPAVENEEGEKVQLSHGTYSQLLESENRDVRKNAFEQYYSVYEGLQNTFASTLQGNVRYHNYDARVHNYDSARHAALSNNHIPESVHKNLIETVNAHLPSFHRYMALRKEIMELEELHFYDLYAPLVEDGTIEYTYEEAKEETLKALAPLGEGYLDILEEAFDNRWIDVVENKGKRSGAFSSGTYDTDPYILMNWHDSLDQLYTLVHELGHSVHSYLSNKNQDYVYSNYPIFLAEIASTTNENILTDYLLEKAEDPKERFIILNQYLDGFKGTVFRQTQFAEFEHLIHEEAADNTPLTAQFLNEEYGKINKKYYGDAVIQDEEIALEWSRIPHFYYNYYVYQYATGFSAAVALADRILNEEGALEKYLLFLEAGSSDYPIEVMKKAGVDMTQTNYLEKALEIFSQRVDELEELVKEIK